MNAIIDNIGGCGKESILFKERTNNMAEDMNEYFDTYHGGSKCDSCIECNCDPCVCRCECHKDKDEVFKHQLDFE